MGDKIPCDIATVRWGSAPDPQKTERKNDQKGGVRKRNAKIMVKPMTYVENLQFTWFTMSEIGMCGRP